MANNGKHIAKNNPRANNKKIVASAELAAFLITLGLGINGVVKHQESKIEKERMEHYQIANDEDVLIILNSIINNYNTYQLGTDKLNTLGYIFEYISNSISNPKITNNERIAILNTIVNDEDIYEKVYDYIIMHNTNTSLYEEKEIYTQNLEIILNNQDIMNQIHDASNAYHVPEEVLISLIARNIKNNELNISSSFGSEWYRLDSRRSAHNYTTGNDDLLNEWHGSDIMRLAAILANSIKEENADLYSAITTVLAGPTKMNEFRRNNNEAYSDYISKTNEVISYVSAYLNDQRISLDYGSVIEDRVYTTTFESTGYYDYYVSLLNSVLETLDIQILQNYGYNQSLK